MNYIGSKRTLMGFLYEIIQGVTGYNDDKGYIFADLFAGTSAVGSFFRNLGWSVISNDIQYYSYVLAKHYIENDDTVRKDLFNYLNSLPDIEGFIYKNYCQGSGSGRNYFTDKNGKKCDAIRTELERLHTSKEIDDSTYFFILASLINSIDKCANTASVYGAFLKQTKKSAQKEFVLEPVEIIKGIKGSAFNESANDVIKHISGDVLYLDPPYNARQYCSNYHMLETIARYDSPVLSGATGMRPFEAQKSEFCSKVAVEKAFEDIIANADFKYIFLSYNNEGLMSLDTIKNIMSKYGNYFFFTKEYRRFKADTMENRNTGAKETVEYLHCLKK